MPHLSPGLYDQLVDQLLRERLDALAGQRLKASLSKVDPAELPDRVGEVVADWVRLMLAGVPASRRPEATLEIVESLLAALGDLDGDGALRDRMLAAPLRRLRAVQRLDPTDAPIPIRQPLTPLRDTVLMTNAPDQPSVGREIEAEIDSADRIDLVLAFIRWTGIRTLLDPLRKHVAAGKPLRVITTVYTGSTELRALEALRGIGAEVKVSYDTTTTRLHAKAWMFQRDSGFSTVYIGSSNLTFSAQVAGLEWNVRASERQNPGLVAAFERTFDTYWADHGFEDLDAERFRRATEKSEGSDSILTPFAIEPYPFQRQILERLQVERRRGNAHNLVAAATGTGKTIIAALDYRHLRGELERSRLLFVAHRKEILEQSRTTFRHVLRDGAFGELWVGGNRPQAWEHVFASIQSLHANDVEAIDPAHFDVVIVDEFHHAAAASYEALLDHVQPLILTGLTATPERTDGLDVLRWFGGRIAVELRLWDALEQGLLAPFHYFGIHDATDLRGVPWKRGTGYDTGALTNLYTANDLWAAKVIQAVGDKVGDPTTMRALGFCVSIAHARFMAERFEKAGMTAVAVTSRSSAEERRRALDGLRDGGVQILFTVDLFNEGVDIPAMDVVLMLRPTESATIFLQQLGRGLRRHAGKDVLTVLDFVGHARTEFRFDLRYRRLLGRTRREIESDLQQDFPFLPAGCHLELDPVAKEIVLENIRQAIPARWQQRVAELRLLGDVDLATFLEESGLELGDWVRTYKGGRGWSALRRAAGLPVAVEGPEEGRFARGIGRMLHLDDQPRIGMYRWLLDRDAPPDPDRLSVRRRRALHGLLLTVLNPKRGEHTDLAAAAATLWRHPALREELVELLPLLEPQVVHLHEPLDPGGRIPLQVHASYTREEILAAFGASTIDAPLPLQTGVYWHEPSRTDLLFVTLQKSERDYSPSTRYLDYAISERLFHWESQANTAEHSQRGQDYVHHAARGRRVVLFVRTAKQGADGQTMPYLCLGEATYLRHQSERPMQITWRLARALPGDTFARWRAAVA
jgi:superfamily II DNA or RNA helicase